MPPFWAAGRREEQGAAVLPTSIDDYAERSPSPPRISSRAAFAAGSHAASGASSRPRQHTLPATVIRRDERREREFSNRHIGDKRAGASFRAEDLRRQILRGSQEQTVLRGARAFEQRDSESYRDCDRLQPEAACSGDPATDAIRARIAAAEAAEPDSSSDSGSSSAPDRGKRRRSNGRTSSPTRRCRPKASPVASSGGEVQVDFF
mmetsp:Transcript_40592/g.91557  ORF Transcript_40592/g.91557 Transcript_40592/m.91557 type:complete len:206 (-) Transcript_40592:26-643(-)